MPDTTFTVTAELTLRVNSEDLARGIVGQWSTGMPGLDGLRIVAVTEGSARTWDDDCRDAERLDRDDNRPITEAELLNGYGAEIDGRVRNGRLPHKLAEDVTGRFPR